LRDITKRSQHEITTARHPGAMMLLIEPGHSVDSNRTGRVDFFLMKPARDPPRIRPQRNPRL
jgi:hypothetical protein